MKKSTAPVSRFTAINLARQAGLDDHRLGKDKTRMVETQDGTRVEKIVIPDAFLNDDSLRCAYEHGVRWGRRYDSALRAGRSDLAYTKRIPEHYAPEQCNPLPLVRSN